MLTYPSDPLPHIVCPMDEDDIPPNHYSSAPPHSDPPPTLLPLSSVTPSCARDGTSGHRRSGRIQGIRDQTPKKQSVTDNGAAPNFSLPNQSQRKGGNMVQVSQSKQPAVEGAHGHGEPNKDGFDFGFAAELQHEQNEQKSRATQTEDSSADNVAEHFTHDTMQLLDATKPDVDTCVNGGSAGEEDAPAPKGWVIGPLFQSLKSKMASFTDIVFSPVKLFRTNPPFGMDPRDKLSPWPLPSEPTSDVQNLEPRDTNQQSNVEVEGALKEKTVSPKYSKKLLFDEDVSTQSSEQTSDCAVSQEGKDSAVFVPSQHSFSPRADSEDISESIESVIRSSLLYHSSPDGSPSPTSTLKVLANVTQGQRGKASVRPKPAPRKTTANRKKVSSKTLTAEVKMEESGPEILDVQVSHIKVDKTLADTDRLQPNGEDNGRKTEISYLVQPFHSLNTNGIIPEPTLDTQQMDCTLNPESYSAGGPGGSKKELKVDYHSQDSLLKRKRLMADVCAKADAEALIGQRPLTKKAMSVNTGEVGEEARKPARKRHFVPTRISEKDEQEILATINEVVLNAQTDFAPDAMSVCPSDKSNGGSENDQKGSTKVMPSGSCKRLKTKTALGVLDVNTDNSMDLETTLAITSTKQGEQQALEVLVRPAIKQLRGTIKCKNVFKKPLKRKSPNQASSLAESTGINLFSTSLASPTDPYEFDPFEFTPADHSTCPNGRVELKQLSKRPKKGSRVAVKSPASGDLTINLLTKEDQFNKIRNQNKVDPLYVEIPPLDSNPQPGPSPSSPHLDCFVQLDNEVKQFIDGAATAPVADEVFPTDADSGNNNNHSMDISKPRSSSRRRNLSKPRSADNQSRKSRVTHRRTRKGGGEETNTVTMEDADLESAAGTSSSPSENPTGLLRSYSCPEIPSLHPHDAPTSSAPVPSSSLRGPPHGRVHPRQRPHSAHTPASIVHHIHKSLQRARRHTVCSLEVEREIAPLCLRKEVYPSRRSFPYDSSSAQGIGSPLRALSPTTSALASCFLSSPLAFLSKRFDSSTSGHLSSPSSTSSSSSSIYPSSPATAWLHPGFIQRSGSLSAALESSNSELPSECEIAQRQRREEENDDENMSSSSQEFEDGGMREEKALSDSEIKVVQKHEERGKVSSIRIRKTLPKPQNNLTPMGLPKAIRLKKKEFSLEEIYTNKNYNKPPESRLETLFEVPLNRRNGSESCFGQKRVKRFIEFLEMGEARRPKKPLVGAGKPPVTSSRTRRGGGFPKDEPSLAAQDVDSVLCAKLDQLSLWLIQDQADS